MKKNSVGGMSCCQFNGTAEYFSCLTVDNRIKVWSTGSGELLHNLSSSRKAAVEYTCLCWCGGPGVLWLAVGTAAGGIELWDVRHGRQLAGSGGHARRVTDLCFDLDRGLLVSASESGEVCGWDPSALALAWRLQAESGGVFRVGVGGGLLATCGARVRLWDLSTRAKAGKLPGHAGVVSHCALLPGLALTAASERLLHLWRGVPPEKDLKGATEAPRQLLLAPFAPARVACALHRSVLHVAAARGTHAAVWALPPREKPDDQPRKPLTKVKAPEELLDVAFAGEQTLAVAMGSALAPRFAIVQIADKSGTPLKKCRLPGAPQDATAEKKKMSKKEGKKEVSRKRSRGGHGSEGMDDGDDDDDDGDDDNEGGKSGAASMRLAKRQQVLHGTEHSARAAAAAEGAAAVALPGGGDERSFEERMAALRGGLALVSDAARRPSARLGGQSQSQSQGAGAKEHLDSLEGALAQALHTDDDALFEEVLREARDPKVLQETCQRLDVALVLPLIKRIVRQLQEAPRPGMDLLRWVSALLCHRPVYLASQPDVIQALASLYHVLEARLALLGKYMKLHGRLEFICSLANQRKSGGSLGGHEVDYEDAIVFEEEGDDEEEDSGEDDTDAND